MKITADTNVLLRAVLPDDPAQRDAAIDVLRAAEVVAISIHSLCEFAWVLTRRYGASRKDIAEAIRLYADTANVVLDRPTAEAGLRTLDAGGDFADGVIAYDGNWLGGEIFVSFDRKAVSIMVTQGQNARLLSVLD
jgi:predicted nucleic-acid-binding protein